MRIGLSLPTMLAGIDGATVRNWCQRIEADGYDSIGYGERIAYHNLELFSVLATAAAVTDRVRIMSTVVVLPMHSEVWVAKQSATMHVLSDGRYTLGVGVGGRSGDYRALERGDRRRFERLDHQVGRIRSVWAGEPVVTEGEEPDPIETSAVGPRAAAGAIPILSGAMGPRSLERSAHWADGIAGFELDPSADALRGTLQRIDGAWEQVGRTEAPYRMTSFWFGLGNDGRRLHVRRGLPRRVRGVGCPLDGGLVHGVVCGRGPRRDRRGRGVGIRRDPARPDHHGPRRAGPTGPGHRPPVT